MVDSRNVSVGEKMLRLQNSLSGKALNMIKDLGYSNAAYERAKVKLEKRFGGERRQQIKHLTALRNWPKLRPRNLQDLPSAVGENSDQHKRGYPTTRPEFKPVCEREADGG